MESETLVLNAVVLVAAVLQSATGVGFGIIAGPAFLVILHDVAGIQISIMLNLLIAALLGPSLWKHVDRAALNGLTVGVILGTPLGLLIYLNLNLATLKGLAAGAVLFSLIMLLRTRRPLGGPSATSAGERISIGIAAGAMGGSLAMPGPIPAAWMSIRRYDKETIRATVLLLFVAAYTIALLLQYLFAGIETENLSRAAALVPATVVGVWLGHLLAERISARAFRRFLVVVLGLTIALLLLTISS